MDKRLGWRIAQICLVALIMLGIGFYPLLHHVGKTPTTRQVCLPELASIPQCFKGYQQLSNQPITEFAVSPDGWLVASAFQDTVDLWDLHQGKRIRTLRGHTNWVSAIAFSPDGKMLATGSLGKIIKLWDLETGEAIAAWETNRPSRLTFSPDGTWLASASRYRAWADGVKSPGGVQIWQVATQTLVQTIGSEAVSGLSFSPNGRWLAIATDETLELWDFSRQQWSNSWQIAETTSLAFTPDSRFLVTNGKVLETRQIPEGKIVQSTRSVAADLALRSDGAALLTASGGTIYAWRFSPRRFLGGLRASHYSRVKVDFAQAEEAIISAGSDGLHLWQRR